MRKILSIRSNVRDKILADVDLEMLTIRRNHRDVETLVTIPARPVKRRLQDDLFRRIALRLVKSTGRFRNPENISNAVIANAIGGTEVRVRVVVKRAPSNA